MLKFSKNCAPDHFSNTLLEKKLGQANWTELLKPVLQGIPAKIRIVDVSGPERTGRGSAKAARSRKKGTFCVGITQIGYGSKTFEISDVRRCK